MRRILAPLLLVLLLALALPAAAGDRAAQLDQLFAQLKTAERQEAAALQLEIWRLWFTYDGADTEIPALMERGSSAMQGHDHAVAEAAFSAVIERDADFAEGWNRRATVRYLRGDIHGSIADIGQVLAREPRHFGALSGLGLCRIALGDTRGAIEAYERALAANPRLDGARGQIARLRQMLAGEPI